MYPQSVATNHLVGNAVGDYYIERLLGQNAINVVYAARSQKQSVPVMFTTFTLPDRFSIQAQERFKGRFMRVVSTLVRLRHQNILPIYDFGIQPGCLYMVTSLTMAEALATSLQRQSRFTAAQVLEIMRQIAEGLDYTHHSGIVHGSLKCGNILLDGEQKVQIAGFGLTEILALAGIEQIQHPYAHLLSVALAFLGDSFTIAPEVVQGMSVGVSADIYAMGIVLFELLSGKPPFAEADPLKTALARLQKPVPSILELRSDLPPSIDLVLQRALEIDPMSRYQSASELVVALEQALRGGDTAKHVAVTAKQSVVLPTEYNLHQDDKTWGGMAAEAVEGDARLSALQDRYKQQVNAGTSTYAQPLAPQDMPTEALNPLDEASVDSFVWWSTASLSSSDGQTFSPATREQAYQQPTFARPLSSNSSVDKKRRRMVAALATGGVVVLAGLGVGGVGLAHMLQGSPKRVQGSATQPSTAPTSTPAVAANPTKTVQPSPTATAKKPTPTATSMPSPTPKPSPTPSHTGTVVGSTSQGVNTSTTFVNPVDGNGSLLINLPSGAFVAFESACTHEGVKCYYDPGSHLIICPRHNAHFDPAHGATVLQGPPPRPLPAVPIHVNGDGTITVG
jgi:serine/threonine protein kinase/Rieske Fe-S protein